MAEEDARIKRRKTFSTFPQIAARKYKSLLEATNLIENNLLTCFVLLKIKNSNASSSANFSSTCFLEFVRSCDANDERPADKKYELYYFSDVFVRGVEIIRNFLKDEKLPEDKAECVALENLINVINKQEEIARKLANFLDCTTEKFLEQRETLWSIELAHHLLKELAVNQSYVVDHYSKKEVEQCFCGETVTGKFGDCSIGSAEVWHGRLDILLGNSQDVALTVVSDEDEDEDSTKSSFEIKNEGSLKSNYTRILAETTVFALVQKRFNPHFENYLIPTIGISNSHVLIFMYDAEHDILLESSDFSLMNYFGEQQMIPYRTILALWLTINYRYFCTGITMRMKTRGFTADFFKNVAEDKKRVYLEDVKFGCRIQEKIYPSDYLRDQADGPMFAITSRPYNLAKRLHLSHPVKI